MRYVLLGWTVVTGVASAALLGFVGWLVAFPPAKRTPVGALMFGGVPLLGLALGFGVWAWRASRRGQVRDALVGLGLSLAASAAPAWLFASAAVEHARKS